MPIWTANSTRPIWSRYQAGEYEDGVLRNSLWETGDWNGDQEFGSGDLVVAFQEGGFETGPKPAAAAVPEPASFVLLWLALSMLVRGGSRID